VLLELYRGNTRVILYYYRSTIVVLSIYYRFTTVKTRFFLYNINYKVVSIISIDTNYALILFI